MSRVTPERDAPGYSEARQGFVRELRRRRVLPIAGVYIAVAWLVTEIAAFLLEQASAPTWALRLLAIVFVVGFPVAIALAWIVQRQPGGVWAFDPSTGQRQAVLRTVQAQGGAEPSRTAGPGKTAAGDGRGPEYGPRSDPWTPGAPRAFARRVARGRAAATAVSR